MSVAQSEVAISVAISSRRLSDDFPLCFGRCGFDELGHCVVLRGCGGIYPARIAQIEAGALGWIDVALQSCSAAGKNESVHFDLDQCPTSFCAIVQP